MFGEKYVLGYDLSNEYAQISYMGLSDDMPVTLALVGGTEEYNIPAFLFKRKEVNQWFYGQEAVNYNSREEGELIDNLWERALVGEPVTVVENQFDPVALLSLFVKRSLSLMNSKIKNGKLVGIMFTVPELTKRAIEVLNSVRDVVAPEDSKVLFEGREESIYYYVIHQPVQLWNHDTLVYDFSDRCMKSYRFTVNKLTKPKVAFVEGKERVGMIRGDENLDETFLRIIENDEAQGEISGAYLIGDGFEDDWCNESLRELCNGRRAFRGNNLYSKGACYAIRNIATGYVDRTLIFLGKEKLKSNVGMNVDDGDQEVYKAILNGGDNWFDSKEEFDVILKSGNKFDIVITPLDGSDVRVVEIVLDGLNRREDKTSRIHLKIYAESEDNLRVCATDMGFGELFPSTHQLFTKSIKL